LSFGRGHCLNPYGTEVIKRKGEDPGQKMYLELCLSDWLAGNFVFMAKRNPRKLNVLETFLKLESNLLFLV